MPSILIRDEAHWHELRAGCVGGSEIAAIFNLSSYLTYWQLWHQKAGNLPAADLSDNKAVQAGRFFEEGIARWAAEKWEWSIGKVHEYRTCDLCPGLGATLDYEISGDHIPVEIKWSVFGHGWRHEGEDIVEAPEGYLLQVQSQIAVTERVIGRELPGGWLVAFLSGEPRKMWVPRRAAIIDAIREEVAYFWQTIRDKKEPDPDFTKDGAALLSLFEERPRTNIEIDEGSPLYADVVTMFDQRAAADELEKLAKAAKDEMDARILDVVLKAAEGRNTDPDAVTLRVGEARTLKIVPVAPSPGKLVTEDMVGTRVGARAGHSRKYFRHGE